MAARIPTGSARRRIACLVALAAVIVGADAPAHGFGQRFDLPVPLWLWMIGAGLSVILSFAAVIDFLPGVLERLNYPRITLLRHGLFPRALHRGVVWTLRIVAVALFALTIIAGIAGLQEPASNLAPTMVWVVLWVGVAFASALIGDIWALLNPLRTLFIWLEWTYAALTKRTLVRRRCYPPWLGVWPAVVFMLVFAWGEHLWVGAVVPFNLGVAILAYTLMSFIGMFLYGREDWLQNGEAFTVVFALFARFAPLEFRVPMGSGVACCNGPPCATRTTECVNGYVCLQRASNPPWELNLRAPAVGLLNDRRCTLSMIVFVVLVLSAVTFDGFIETALWHGMVDSLAVAGAPNVLTGIADMVGFGAAAVLTSVALVLFPVLFLALLWLCCWAMARISPATKEPGAAAPASLQLASRFILTLVPIAIAYHLAHYLTLLVTAGQRLIPLSSDPLGFGWDLFGTAQYLTDPGLLDVRTVWYLVVGAIICGHILSVYLAHVVALDLYHDKRRAIRAQLPLLGLMVAYTMFSLWLLAQPVFV